MTRAGSASLPASSRVADRARRFASIAVPFLAILPLKYRVPLETALVMLFPNAG